ncbi:STAS domain-containing protein [Mesobacillus foraminis]|uniref:STAS domain-containing protein n=1 Tax=Mesobacillus foraminis TaxID=279826 RepID=UPI0039A19D76
MEYMPDEEFGLTDFIIKNRQTFEQTLLKEAVNVASKITDILNTGNIDLLKNAEKLVIYITGNQGDNLIAFAKQEGVAWAQHSLTLSFKLEWVQAIRRTLWHFMYQFDQVNGNDLNREEFFSKEKRINDLVDKFLNTFFISYSNYKDELINSQRKLVEHLSVPIIPISPTVAVLPLIGLVDSYRMQTIEEKVLMEIANLKVQRLIMDLSGVADMEMDVIDLFQKVLKGISMMGCKATITGLRPELVRKMVHSGIAFNKHSETRGTLQETLRNHLIVG